MGLGSRVLGRAASYSYILEMDLEPGLNSIRKTQTTEGSPGWVKYTIFRLLLFAVYIQFSLLNHPGILQYFDFFDFLVQR